MKTTFVDQKSEGFPKGDGKTCPTWLFHKLLNRKFIQCLSKFSTLKAQLILHVCSILIWRPTLICFNMGSLLIGFDLMIWLFLYTFVPMQLVSWFFYKLVCSIKETKILGNLEKPTYKNIMVVLLLICISIHGTDCKLYMCNVF